MFVCLCVFLELDLSPCMNNSSARNCTGEMKSKERPFPSFFSPHYFRLWEGSLALDYSVLCAAPVYTVPEVGDVWLAI